MLLFEVNYVIVCNYGVLVCSVHIKALEAVQHRATKFICNDYSIGYKSRLVHLKNYAFFNVLVRISGYDVSYNVFKSSL